MRRKTSYVSVTDLFCGAGGQSEGITRAGGEVVLAMNHWARAIETHNSNFPNTLHKQADISQTDPRKLPTTTLLCASPECTNHTVAKGVARKQQLTGLWDQEMDDAATKSRATMWDVPRFAEVHQYEAIIIENVVEAAKWVMWDAWLHAMKSLGYTWKCLYLNSMHFQPVPQSRDRLYVVFWKKGNKAPYLDFQPLAYCLKCGEDIHAIQSWKSLTKQWGRYKSQYIYRCPRCAMVVEPYYYAGANAINWALPTERLGDRKKPLADATMARIIAGMKKFSHFDAPDHPAYVFAPETIAAMGDTYQSFLVTTGHGGPQNASRQRSINAPLNTIWGSVDRALVNVPMVFPFSYTGDDRAKLATDPLPTQTARQDLALATFQQPFVVKYYGSESSGYSLSDGIGTISSHDHLALVSPQPFLVKNFTYEGNAGHSLTGGLGAITAVDHHSLAQPETADVDDCRFRMLQPAELKKGMAFPDEYIITGNKRDQVHQIGNAVTPPVLAEIGKRVLATL